MKEFEEMESTGVSAELYAEVLQYYARQMQALDAGKVEEYADTFTDDAVFGHTPGREPARTRGGILSDLYEVRERLAADPQQRRHMFTMVDVEQLADGRLRSTCYALVLTTRPGDGPQMVRSCVVRDALVREDGRLRNQERLVDHDGF
ncbi:nuclear transport factor 2 family protein [Streptomyces doebereineriae]|uniref:Nuclear transport factor 2 family protein n=1 Tax=Streptomyces doebereineriae TaxID=3075528 RepID=A0ABU2V631_9ACTN|nr:nuclear transport factor 2 family protein [Streptomyces sp. DSM 41640]MDT0481020.1 nuclear transport factor 2 family protein [Streptomyces sp. DSM 41640]